MGGGGRGWGGEGGRKLRTPLPFRHPSQTSTHASTHAQAARDAEAAAEAQIEWLKEALPAQFTERLLKQVGGVGGWVGWG